MFKLVLAFLISVVFSSAFYLIGTAAGLPPAAAAGLAGLPVLSSTNIYDFLETRTARQKIAGSGSGDIKTIDQFSIKSIYLFAFVVLMSVGVFSIGPLVSGFFTGVGVGMMGAPFDPNDRRLAVITMAHALPLYAVAVFHICRWIGIRSTGTSSAVVIAVSAIVVGAMAVTFAGMFALDANQYAAFYGSDRTLYGAALETAKTGRSIILLEIVAVVAVMFGRRRRLSRYFSFLIDLIPGSERTTIVDLARDEAMAAASRTVAKSAIGHPASA